MSEKAFDQRNLIDKRIHLVCEINLGSAGKFRIATDEVYIPGTGGGLFAAGLDGFSFSDEIELFDIGAPSRSVSIVAYVDTDVAELIAKGFDLTSAKASLWQWVEGSEYADLRPIIVDGRIDKPEYGEIGEALRFSLKSNIYESEATYPAPGLAVISPGHGMPATFTNGTDTHGTIYPMVFGQPGNTGPTNVPGSPVVGAYNTAFYHLACGHHVAPGTEVNITEKDASLPPLVAYMSNGTDLQGNNVAFINLPSTIETSWGFTSRNDAEIYIQWKAGSFSQQNPFAPGSMLRGMGDVLAYFLALAPDIDFDRGRTMSVIQELNRVEMDFVITETVNVWEWLRSNLLPFAPISMVNSGEGWYPVIIERALADAAAVALVNVDLYQWERTSAVQYEFADGSPRNSFNVEYGVNARDDTAIGVAVLSANEDSANTYVRASAARYGDYVKTGSIDCIARTSEALKILKYWSRIYSMPMRVIEYVAPSEWSWLRAGMSVKITDPALHITEQTMIVQAIEWSDEQAIGLRLVWLEDLLHDDRAT